MQTIQQQRAEFALEKVEGFLRGNSNGKEQKEYKSYASSLPSMIHNNGLGQAAAFYKSKGGRHEDLYKLLSEWLKKEGQPFQGKELLKGITTSNMETYQRAQAEAQALIIWVKQFSKALIVGDDG